jgi:hypothetical protein
MTDLFNRLDTWISLAGIVLVAYLWIRRRVRLFMSRRASVPKVAQNEWEQRSDAVEQGREQAGTGGGNMFHELVEQLAADDATLLDILAQVRGEDGE